jgi:hypothetical protein
VKAEKLARDALRIRTLIFGSKHNNLRDTTDLLAKVLMLQGKLGNEAKELLLRSLANSIRNEGPEGANAATANSNLGCYYKILATKQPTADLKRNNLQQAKSHVVEAIRIFTKVYGPAHPDTTAARDNLASIFSELP